MMKVSNKSIKERSILDIIVICYLLLPFTIFIVGWCKWFVWIPGILILGLCFYRMYRRLDDNDTESGRAFEKLFTGRNTIKWIVVLVLITVWTILSGIGGFVFQNEDHTYRNALFSMLVNYEWPVKADVFFENKGIIQTRGLIYYIGFWMPAAIVGKLFGIQTGYFFQVVWAVTGIFLFYCEVCLFRKKFDVWPFIIWMLFSGADIIGIFILYGKAGAPNATTHLEWWSSPWFQYSSNTTQLFWVFNQAIPAWLITVTMLNEKKNNRILFLWATGMINCTLPFVGMIPLMVYVAISNNMREHKGRGIKMGFVSFFKEAFTVENFLGGGFVGLISFAYLWGNVSGGKNNVGQLTEIDGAILPLGNYIYIYIVFAIMEFLLYFVVLFRSQKKHHLYWITLLWLLICPFIHIGSSIDFCMRASIPAIVCLVIMIIQTISEALSRKEKTRLDYATVIVLVILLIVGLSTPVHEFTRTVSYTANHYRYVDVTDADVMSGDNFSGNIEKNLFFNLLAK